jgi:L-aspartate oxidase
VGLVGRFRERVPRVPTGTVPVPPSAYPAVAAERAHVLVDVASSRGRPAAEEQRVPTVPIEPRPGEATRVDVVVVGAGVAGLVAALDLLDLTPDLTVAVLDKGAMGSSGSTPLAQGGMAAAVGPGDSPGLHAEDTLRAGDGLSDPEAVRVVASETPARVADLVARGAAFDRHTDGSFALALEGGQQVPRSVRAADASGAEIFRTLRTAATGRVQRVQGIACQLATVPGRVVGVWALLDEVDASPAGPAHGAGLALLLADAVVLATGGCGGLYAATTNRDGATADGVALAHEAGAALIDMEFVQFHPTGLKVDPARLAPGDVSPHWRLLLTEALRGAGARLVDREGHRFMVDRHPDAELGPRHIVTKAILDQPGGAWLDATHLTEDVLAAEFPTVLAGARRHGFDLAREAVPVEPCQHYMIGGVATDLDGATSLPGLWAAGEVACAGVHGANRMAGNSLAQSCVFGHRVAAAIARERHRIPEGADPAAPLIASNGPASETLARTRSALRVAMTEGAGAIRDAASLERARTALEEGTRALGTVPHATRESVELHHLLTVGRLVVASALLRTESRGVHWRDDHPAPVDDWAGRRLRVTRSDRTASAPGAG